MRPIFPGYELRELLGSGPTCRVYAALHLETGSDCAVKALREDWADESTAVKLLRREVRAGLAVRHPHLVRFLEASVSNSPYFLVMELLPGETLRQRLRREFAIEALSAVAIARQCAEALAALHRAGFVHGDIKPENVRLTGAGSVKLMDLGFAHQPGEDPELAERGHVLGTANYLAPELCRCKAIDTFAADVFSLGVTLFELLTGELPYEPGSSLEVMTRHRDQSPATLFDRGGPWPPGLPQLVGRMMARWPEGRPSAPVLVRELIALEIAALRRCAG